MAENIELKTLTEAEERDDQSQKQFVKAKWYRPSGVRVGSRYLAVAVFLLFVVGGLAVSPHRPKYNLTQDYRVGVVGGVVVTDPTSFTWMASLQQEQMNSKPVSHKHFCGGILIREDVVMTAAHCVDWIKHPSDMRVVLGTHDLKDASATVQIFKFRHMPIIHKYWVPNDKRHRNDIALLQLDRKATLNKGITLAALPPSGDVVSDTIICYITGWGDTEWTREQVSDTLMSAHLPLIRNDICSKPKWWGRPIYHTQLCAGGTSARAGCRGDSGGPLNCLVNKKYVVHGIDSWAAGKCNVAKKPNVFTRTSYFISWIQSNMPPM